MILLGHALQVLLVGTPLAVLYFAVVPGKPGGGESE